MNPYHQHYRQTTKPESVPYSRSIIILEKYLNTELSSVCRPRFPALLPFQAVDNAN